MRQEQTFAFREWTPDKAEIASGQSGDLTICKGCIPRIQGYGPLETLLDLGITAIDARARGWGVARDASDDTFNFVGTATKLYVVTGAGVEDVSRASPYTIATEAARWEFDLLGNTVIAVNPVDQPQYYELDGGSTDFDDLADPPLARHVATIRDQVFIGDLVDGSDTLPRSVQWSAIGNAQSWPTPGSDAALEVLSGRQDLPGEGRLQRIIGGTEAGLIFLERGIHRAEFIGGDLAWQFVRVEPERGLLTPGACVAKGRQVLYLDEDGWYLSDYTSSKPVGKGRIDRYFFNDLSPSHLDRMSAVADPESTRFIIGYTSSSAGTASPDKLLIYDWALDRWTHADLAHELLVRTLALSLTLDGLGTVSLDDPPYAGASLDDLQAAGPSKLGAWNTSNKLTTFAAQPMSAVFETGDISLFDQRFALLQYIRPLVKGSTATVQVSAISKSSGTHLYSTAVPQSDDGRCPVRRSGRYHKVRVTIPAGGFTDAVGFDWEAALQGRR